MIDLDVRTFGEETWFLEIHPLLHLRAAYFAVEWQGPHFETVEVEFSKTRLALGDVLLIEVPAGATFVDVSVSARDGQDQRLTADTSLEIADYVESQRKAGVLAGEPLDIDARPVVQAIHEVGKEIKEAIWTAGRQTFRVEVPPPRGPSRWAQFKRRWFR